MQQSRCVSNARCDEALSKKCNLSSPLGLPHDTRSFSDPWKVLQEHQHELHNVSFLCTSSSNMISCFLEMWMSGNWGKRGCVTGKAEDRRAEQCFLQTRPCCCTREKKIRAAAGASARCRKCSNLLCARRHVNSCGHPSNGFIQRRDA